MLQGLAQSSGRHSEHAHGEVLRNAQSKPIPPGTMRAALEAIAPASMLGRRAYLLELMHGKLTWGAIRHWAADRTTPPQWAREILKAKLAAQCGELQRIIDRL